MMNTVNFSNIIKSFLYFRLGFISPQKCSFLNSKILDSLSNIKAHIVSFAKIHHCHDPLGKNMEISDDSFCHSSSNQTFSDTSWLEVTFEAIELTAASNKQTNKSKILLVDEQFEIDSLPA